MRLIGCISIVAVGVGAILLFGPRPGGRPAPADPKAASTDNLPPSGSAPPPADPKAYADALEAERKANALLAEGKEEAAVPILREALALHQRAGSPPAAAGDAATNLGAALFRTGHAVEAAEAMRRRVDRAPDDGEAWQLLARIQFHRGLLLESDRAIAKARALLPPSIVLTRMALRIQTQLSRRDEAMEIAREAIAADPSEETLVVALEAYIRFRAFEEARPLLDRLRAS
ncbi:MAG: hypothetical protein JXP34_20175, partial [Planctomycetes bacterium]|nr:hypothetical protein [Planctomycetota bacterium]